jgi:hypothetical protein
VKVGGRGGARSAGVCVVEWGWDRPAGRGCLFGGGCSPGVSGLNGRVRSEWLRSKFQQRATPMPRGAAATVPLPLTSVAQTNLRGAPFGGPAAHRLTTGASFPRGATAPAWRTPLMAEATPPAVKPFKPSTQPSSSSLTQPLTKPFAVPGLTPAALP